MATTISTQDIVDAKRDIDDIGKAVNEKVIVSPRYGEDFKSLPMAMVELETAIEAAAAAGAGANGWTDLLVLTQDGSTQRAKNSSFQSQINNKASTAYVDAQDAVKADKSYVDAQDANLQTQINGKASAAYLDNALDEQTQTVNTALSQLSTAATKFYPTLAEANADIANVEVNQPVQVGEAENGGLYYKAAAEATTLTKSAYDPLTQSKKYTAEKTDFWQVKDVQIKQFDAWSPYSVGFVGLNGKMPLGIRKDGAVVAQKMVTEDLETSSQIISNVKLQKLDPFTGYVFGVGNGFKFPFLIGTDGSVNIDVLNVNKLNRNIEEDSILELNARIKSATQEWWISPVHTYVDFPYPRVLSGVYSENGEIIVSEYMIGCGTTKRINVGQTPEIDDHNAPSLFVEKNRRTVCTWTQHNLTNYIELKVSSSDGDIRTLEYAEVQKLELGLPVTYTQIYKNEYLSDELQDTFWCFSRVNMNNWHLIVFSVSQATGVATLVSNKRLIAGEAQFYFTTSRHENIIRIAAGYNPAAAQNYVMYYEIDMVTGEINDMFGATISNISGTNSPLINASASTSRALEQTDASKDRRLFYVRSGLNPAIAYAEWDLTDPDDAMYKVASLENGLWVIRDVVSSGKRFGYTASANYLAGISFPSKCTKDELIIARFDNDTNEGVLERAILINNVYVRTEVLRVKNEHLLRPINPINGGDICMYTHLYKYGATSLFSFESDIKSIVVG